MPATNDDSYSERARGGDCVLLADGTGAIRWASPTVEAVLGRPRSDLSTGTTVADVLGTEFVERLEPGDGRVDEPTRRETTVSTADGRAIAVEVAVEPVDESTPLWAYHCRRVDPGPLDAAAVLSRVTDGIVELDTDWRYTYVNDKAAALVDESRESLLGRPIWEVFEVVAGTRMQAAFERAMERQEPVTMDWYADTLDKWLEIRAFPSPTRLRIYFTDDSERMERVSALRHERDVFDELLELAPMGIAVHDADGRFVRVNQRGAEILGLPPEDLVGTTLPDRPWDALDVDGDPLPVESFPLNHVLETAAPVRDVELSLGHPDGSRLWLVVGAAPVFDDDGDISRVVVTFEDVTDRKRAEMELRERENLFSAVFEGTLDALVLADDDGDYVAVNEAACDLYGLPEAELLGRHPREFAPPDVDVDAIWETFLEEGTMRGEFTLVRPDGDVRVTDFAATANVRPGQHLSALRDITERTEATERLEAQRDELDRLNRVNEIIRDVNRAIVAATDRDAVVAAVCRTLGATDTYPLAVSARVTFDGDVQVEHAAGATPEEMRALQSSTGDTFDDAIVEAVETVTPTVVDVRRDDRLAEAFGEYTATEAVRAIANVPLSYEGVVHGVLTIGAVDEDAFASEELGVLAELGQLLGTAIDSIRTKHLLHATVFEELELDVAGDPAPLPTLNERVGGSWTLEGVVPVEDHEYLLYLTATDTDVAALERAAAELDVVEGIRVVGAEGDRFGFELRVSEASPVSALLDAGGWIRGGTIEDGRARFVVDVTAGSDVRAYLHRVERRGVDANLVAKREVERNVPGALFDTMAESELTDRQRSVLEAAYLSGYFEWPRRRTTGEELAAALDISSSTLHQHLRIAMGKVLSQYLGLGSAESSRDDPT
ncbi:PAS domain-containing protein [Halorubellus salinus]|uniref:PAS domain-containing protein n=1 Tax=Halorubellus salinus TaxID=755309 RepID=UPI001D076473|nr:PAS domain-containing protein [Halorubellus salinus]